MTASHIKTAQSNAQFKTGSSQFIDELKKRTFKNGDEILLYKESKEMTLKFLDECGFQFPIVIKKPEGLGIKVPQTTCLKDIERMIGSEVNVEVIDVGKQEHIYMQFSKFVDFMLNKNKRTRILNMISCECSGNSLGESIEPPELARKVDWSKRFWNEPKVGYYPKLPRSVEKYCLISCKDAFTDFHVDFSGTSVWYHIVKGTKDFYMIRPTAANMALFWKWSESRNRLSTFFADQVDACYKCTLSENMTLFLPTGWIHAVLTTSDSLVYGGNYLSSYHIPKQLEIFDMEIKTKVPCRQRFPYFIDLHWFAARGLCKDLETITNLGELPPKYLIQGLKALLTALRTWLRRSASNRFKYHNPTILLKDISREIRRADRLLLTTAPRKPERESTRIKKKPSFDDYVVDFQTAKKIRKNKKNYVSDDNDNIDLIDGKTAYMLPSTSDGNNDCEIKQEELSAPSEYSHLHEMDVQEINNECGIKRDSTSSPEYGNWEKKFQGDLKVILTKLPIQVIRKHIEIEKQMSQAKAQRVYDFVDDESSFSPVDVLPSTSYSQLRERSDPLVYLGRQDEVGHSSSKKIRNMGVVINVKEDRSNDPTEPDSNRVVPSSDDDISLSGLQDDDFIYLSLDESSNDNDESSTQGDKSWNPKSKLSNVYPKQDRPSRQGTQKRSFGKALEAAAAKATITPKEETRPVENTPPVKPPATPRTQQQSTGSRSKKKLHTPKQRLGKILKLHRLGY